MGVPHYNHLFWIGMFPFLNHEGYWGYPLDRAQLFPECLSITMDRPPMSRLKRTKRPNSRRNRHVELMINNARF